MAPSDCLDWRCNRHDCQRCAEKWERCKLFISAASDGGTTNLAAGLQELINHWPQVLKATANDNIVVAVTPAGDAQAFQTGERKTRSVAEQASLKLKDEPLLQGVGTWLKHELDRALLAAMLASWSAVQLKAKIARLEQRLPHKDDHLVQLGQESSTLKAGISSQEQQQQQLLDEDSDPCEKQARNKQETADVGAPAEQMNVLEPQAADTAAAPAAAAVADALTADAATQVDYVDRSPRIHPRTPAEDHLARAEREDARAKLDDAQQALEQALRELADTKLQLARTEKRMASAKELTLAMEDLRSSALEARTAFCDVTDRLELSRKETRQVRVQAEELRKALRQCQNELDIVYGVLSGIEGMHQDAARGLRLTIRDRESALAHLRTLILSYRRPLAPVTLDGDLQHQTHSPTAGDGTRLRNSSSLPSLVPDSPPGLRANAARSLEDVRKKWSVGWH